jgi:hypothetical protein
MADERIQLLAAFGRRPTIRPARRGRADIGTFVCELDHTPLQKGCVATLARRG